ncbi:MAG: GtrA family protein [Paludibacteraceae bacterium]|nr:GtrA family protein [Paludibacteraceae bacterium]
MVRTLGYSITRFIRSQVASFLSSVVDFSITYLLTSFAGVWYILSTTSGVFAGGLVNFLLGRYWVFNARNGKKLDQVFKYILIWASSMLLNLSGTIFFTEVMGMYYMVSKLLTGILVGILFNYNLQKAFVFKIKHTVEN